jgi:hypothetical protein
VCVCVRACIYSHVIHTEQSAAARVLEASHSPQS